MYCANCGARNENRDKFCANCGAAISETTTASERTENDPPIVGGPAEPPHVPNYLVQAILVTIFCCLPFGIVSIVFAAQVNGHVAAGNIVGARRASSLAKTWAWISLILGLVGWIPLYLLFLAPLLALSSGGS